MLLLVIVAGLIGVMIWLSSEGPAWVNLAVLLAGLVAVGSITAARRMAGRGDKRGWLLVALALIAVGVVTVLVAGSQ